MTFIKMKFIKSAGLTNDQLATKTAAEMINIMLGKTYFDSYGNLTDCKPNNVYQIDGVEYDMCLNQGDIIVKNVNNAPTHLYDNISNLVKKLMETYPDLKMRYNVSSSQYVNITEEKPIKWEIINYLQTYRYGKIVENPTSTFLWRISTLDIFNQKQLHLSVNSIIIDDGSLIDLPDGYKSVNFPSVKDLKLYTDGKFLDTCVYYSWQSGITPHICEKYLQLEGYKNSGYHNYRKEFILTHSNKDLCSYKMLILKHISEKYSIYMINWDYICKNIYNRNYLLTIEENINNGLLDSAGVQDIEYKCFHTGLPIYDDCYAIDILQRMTVEDLTAEEIKKLEANDTSYEIIKEDSKVIKRKSKNPKTKIKYMKKYTTPKCLLLSPFYVHQSTDEKIPLFKMLEDLGCSYLIYRTKCPNSILNVINNGPFGTLEKHVLKCLYKDVWIDNCHLYSEGVNFRTRAYTLHDFIDIGMTRDKIYGILTLLD